MDAVHTPVVEGGKGSMIARKVRVIGEFAAGPPTDSTTAGLRTHE